MSNTKTKFSPSFQKLWSSSAASNVSDGLLKTAVPLLATTLTTDPFWISTIAAIVMLPWLLFAIPVGGLVDRINRRQMLALANTVRLSAALLLAFAVGLEFITLPLLLLTTFMFGIGEVIYDTTLQSMIPQVLEKDQLEQGNARLQVTSVTLGEFVGAPLSGLLYAISITLPFLFGAIGVVVAVLLVLTIPLKYANNLEDHKPVEKKNFWADVRFGIRYLYEHKTLLKLVLLTSSIGFFFSASSSTMVLFLTQTLKVPTALFGFLLAMPAIGALLGSVLSHRISKRLGRTTVMAWAMASSSLLVILQGFSPNYIVLAILVTAGTAIITMWNVLLMATYHQIIPTELFGRIHGTRRTLVWGLMPIGSLLGGLIATIDLRMPFFVGGAICFAIALVGFRFIVSLKNLIAESE
ncbi:MAG: hypothetical protein RLZ65_771 [Actinomycetota bacterium]|jgi:MFS family permease